MRMLRLFTLAALLAAGCTTAAQGTRGTRADGTTPTAQDFAAEDPGRTAVMIGGGVVAAAGPAVVVGAIALQRDSQPPVPAFVAGAALTTLGIGTILVAAAVM